MLSCMAGITLAQAETKHAECLEAYSKALSAQSYSIAGRSKTNVDLKALQEAIDFWEQKIIALSRGTNGRIGAHGIIVND